ncbi:effector-associated constant component EACC1 [Nonomuraea sp. C10]|uniref:effector-associated constant component EACC1 n=1 Tax=Nonomuraea sp. C10 TaxID=2600577 RepID=UPI0011CE571D|nr:hypothetical protein [Nonomuraea sp. C10]TXK39955.1 hypothetical protein FR742_10455 [Nonomuraea sp. C10]
MAGTSAEVRELYAWLQREPDLRGAVRLVETRPPPGALGPVAEAVQIITGSPEIIATLAGVTIAWLRYRTSDVKITAKRPDGTEVTVSASRVRTLSNEQTRAVIAEVLTALEDSASKGPPDV